MTLQSPEKITDFPALLSIGALARCDVDTRFPQPITSPATHHPIVLDEPRLNSLQRFLSCFSIKTFETKAFSVKIPHLPQSLDGLRLVQLSDLQFYEYTASHYWAQVISQVEALQPDIIIITGDTNHYGGRYLKQAEGFLSALPRLKRDGSVIRRVAVMGNHDYLDHQGGEAVKRLFNNPKVGFELLVNRAVQLSGADGKSLWISGLDDYEHLVQQGQSAYNAIEQALSIVQAEQAHVFLSHNPHPDIIEYVKTHSKAPHLILSGHTHGGQFSSSLPIIGKLLDTLRKRVMDGPFENRYLNGAYRIPDSGAVLYVNPGTGSSFGASDFLPLPALRMGSKPELTMMVLEPNEGESTQMLPQ